MKKSILIAFLFVFMSSISYAEEIKQNNTTNNTNIEKQSTDDFDDEFSEDFKEPEEDFDPLSGYNRGMTVFNDYVYVNVLSPASKGYAYVVPEPARVGISNVFQNLLFPVRFINNLLQLKFENAATETGRFLINSTFGLLGIMDVAKDNIGWEQKDEDFGQTLGFYGVGEGFHVVLPFLGPSNLRDMTSLLTDSYVNPLVEFGRSDIKYKIPNNTEKTIGLSVFRIVNTTSLHQGEYESLKKDAIDLYPFLKEVYNQNREKLIKE